MGGALTQTKMISDAILAKAAALNEERDAVEGGEAVEGGQP